MDIGLYQSAAALSSLEKWQDAVSQNITSSQVAGYRKRTVEFSSQIGGELDNGSSDEDGTVGAQFPAATGGISYLPGDTQPTGRDLDVAIQGEGFFQLQTEDGSPVYTRNGEFSVRADHVLVNGGGLEVMSESGSPITLPTTGAKITINTDGTIIDGQAKVGRIGVVKFADTSQLRPLAGGMFVPGNGETAMPVESPDLLQGYIEASNVTPMREMVDLVLISRSYESNQRLIKTADDRMQKTLDALG